MNSSDRACYTDHIRTAYLETHQTQPTKRIIYIIHPKIRLHLAKWLPTRVQRNPKGFRRWPLRI